MSGGRRCLLGRSLLLRDGHLFLLGSRSGASGGLGDLTRCRHGFLREARRGIGGNRHIPNRVQAVCTEHGAGLLVYPNDCSFGINKSGRPVGPTVQLVGHLTVLDVLGCLVGDPVIGTGEVGLAARKCSDDRRLLLEEIDDRLSVFRVSRVVTAEARGNLARSSLIDLDTRNIVRVTSERVAVRSFGLCSLGFRLGGLGFRLGGFGLSFVSIGLGGFVGFCFVVRAGLVGLGSAGGTGAAGEVAVIPRVHAADQEDEYDSYHNGNYQSSLSLLFVFSVSGAAGLIRFGHLRHLLSVIRWCHRLDHGGRAGGWCLGWNVGGAV